MIERGERLDGPSAHTGTLPSKTLRETAVYLSGYHARELYGLSLSLAQARALAEAAEDGTDGLAARSRAPLREETRERLVLASATDDARARR